MECYNCGEKGHISRYCPYSVLYCAGSKLEKGIERNGAVNGQEVKDIMLHTGCSQRMVHSRLVPSDKLLEEGSVYMVTLYLTCCAMSELRWRDTSSR